MKSPINSEASCLIRNLIAVAPEDAPAGFALPSGSVEFLAFTGVTDAEIAVAKQRSSAELIEMLRAAGHHPVTDPLRQSLF